MEEIISATAYLDLFLRTLNEPNLVKLFLKFILFSKFDERISLLDMLIHRINANPRVDQICFYVYSKREIEIIFFLKQNLAESNYADVILYAVRYEFRGCHVSIDFQVRNVDKLLFNRIKYILVNFSSTKSHATL
jgi:hypothetical protein